MYKHFSTGTYNIFLCLVFYLLVFWYQLKVWTAEGSSQKAQWPYRGLSPIEINIFYLL